MRSRATSRSQRESAAPVTGKAPSPRPKGKAPEPALQERWPNIQDLIDSGGEITIGAIPSTNLCAITASDPDQCLAMLRVRPDESIVHMLDRIDAAIGHAWVHEEFIDEING